MSDLLDQVQSEQDPITKIISKIPGFGGYIERQSRRDADKLLRDTIGDQYRELWKRVGNVQKDMANQGEIEFLDDMENAGRKIQTFIDKLTTAAYGYAGFFDAVKVNEEELDKLYAFDVALLDNIDEIGRAIDNVDASRGTDGMPAALGHLMTLARDLVITIDSRDEVMLAVG